ncbi:MAG: ORF6N domain-containing protein [Bacteroidota bacterium]
MEQNLIKSEIDSRIFTIRGMQVMLDSDLAKLYNVETKVLNQAVKRNLERFPESFRFQLTEFEMQILRSQIVTSSEMHGGRRFFPYVFTEQGVAMLSAVLKSSVAVRVSIEVMEAFVELRKSNSEVYLLSKRIAKLEHRQKNTESDLNKVLNALEGNNIPRSGIFFNDQIFDAYVFSSELITKAKKSIILIDNYIDETTLIQLSKRNKKVNCIIYTEKITAQLKLDLEKHNAQYPPIEIRILKNTHDRFLILDEKELYHLGASLKDLGKRWFAFSKMDGFLKEILHHLR